MKKPYDFAKGKRGAIVPVPKGKTRITIRLDDDVLDWFRQQVHAAGGGNYQTLINSMLRKRMEHRGEPLEDTIRRVVRAELRRHDRRGSEDRRRVLSLGPAMNPEILSIGWRARNAA